jgi:hypothetical protein
MMKKMLFMLSLLCLVLSVPIMGMSEMIDVQIKGIDDGIKTTKQNDYKEAVLFAKREAIERAGVKIKARTTVKDLVINSDYIESEAEALLLPGYTIVDVGYTADGTYQVVLIGKVKTAEEGINSKELRYAKSLIDRGEEAEARKIIADIITNSKEDTTIAEAMYCQVIWGFTSNPTEALEKLKAYYPESRYVNHLEAYFEEKRKEHERISFQYGDIGAIGEKNGDFIAGSKGIVLDTKTGLMWASQDNGSSIQWRDADSYCKDYRGGGYSDWRLPTSRELFRLYDKNRKGLPCYLITRLINVRSCRLWASKTEGTWADSFDYTKGKRYWVKKYRREHYIVPLHVLPVRSGR